MVISILVAMKSDSFRYDKAKKFIDNVVNSGYPKTNAEVVFYLIDDVPTTPKTFGKSPLIRLRYAKEYVPALNEAVEKALGDLIVFADINTDFHVGFLSKAEDYFMREPELSTYLGLGWHMIRKPKIPGNHFFFPLDLFCIKSFLVCSAIIDGEKIRGPWNKLNRKEVMRIWYRTDHLKFKEKLRLLWGAL